MRFALNTSDVSLGFQLEASSGASIIGSATATGATLTAGGFPVGFLAFNSGGTTLDSVRLTATAQDFASTPSTSQQEEREAGVGGGPQAAWSRSARGRSWAFAP